MSVVMLVLCQRSCGLVLHPLCGGLIDLCVAALSCVEWAQRIHGRSGIGDSCSPSGLSPGSCSAGFVVVSRLSLARMACSTCHCRSSGVVWGSVTLGRVMPTCGLSPSVAGLCTVGRFSSQPTHRRPSQTAMPDRTVEWHDQVDISGRAQPASLCWPTQGTMPAESRDEALALP